MMFRSAADDDFAFCKRLYFSENETIMEQLKLDRMRQETTFEELWRTDEARIILSGGFEVGWLQSATHADALFLAQLYIEKSYQRRGIGTATLHALIEEAAEMGKGMKLGVAKINAALSLYLRLGFQVTHEDDMKFYMLRTADASRRTRVVDLRG